MSVISEYKNSSAFKTYPLPLTEYEFLGLSKQENIDFKIWLGLIGEDEIEIAADHELEVYFVNAFKNQKNEHCNYMNPAQRSSHISFWLLQAEADRVCAGLRHGCQFWQLVDWVPTEKELNFAFPQSHSIELDHLPPLQPVAEPKKARDPVKTSHDEWTLDLFGGAA